MRPVCPERPEVPVEPDIPDNPENPVGLVEPDSPDYLEIPDKKQRTKNNEQKTTNKKTEYIMLNPKLQYYADGTPSVLKKRTNYATLRFYQRADVLYQLSKVFCARYFPKFGDRTVDQMVQSARSIKQNIVEGFTDGQTSSEVEIKLLGIARGSNQELLEDYMDYLKYNRIAEWRGNSPRFEALYAFCKEHSQLADFQPYFDRWNDEEIANCCICLCHMVDKGLESYIKNLDRQFVEEGGIRERMTAARLEKRTSQKEQIAQLQAENAALRREIAALKKRLGE